MKHALAALILSCLTLSSIAHADPPIHLTLHADHPLNTINPLFFGSNTLFMYDDKTALADDTFVQRLRDVPIRLLRFPGGDVADNYYWDQHSLDDPKWWPRNDNPNSADTDSFMTFCHKVGAEPLFVVNLESGFVHHDLDSAIKRAADWVAYCRQHDYHVKYWEIGNETFWYHPGKHKRIRVTAAEYGQAFARFATAMKAADPAIQIGAIGLVDPTTSANNTLSDGTTVSPRQPAWWPTVIAAAGPHIDFVTVHSYPGGEKQTYDYFIHKGVWGGETIPSLRTFLDKTLARHVPIILTEWNLSEKSPLRGMALAQAQTNLLCRFLSAGVDMACFWPLRLPHVGNHSLLDYRTFKPHPIYQVFSILSPTLAGGTIISSDSDDPTLFHFAALSADTLTTILIHKSTAGDPCKIAIDFKATQVSGEAIVASSLQSADAHRIPLTCQQNPDGTWTCDLPPYSICVLKLIRPK
ncbi:MAG TPA: hypothetical protein VFE58_17945 [Tepidisphaeraceae bacterium]|jgi:hypothetical protein|nr:hypothetical protein [Tepidisphaeraceae bacterium]